MVHPSTFTLESRFKIAMFLNQLSQVSSNISNLKLFGEFYNVIKNKVSRTMKSGKKWSKSGKVIVFITKLIYSRVTCLLDIRRITLEDFFKYELSPILYLKTLER